MKTLDELIQEFKGKKEAVMGQDEVVVRIMDIVDTLKKRKVSSWTGEQLSAAASELSILLVNLGQTVTGYSLEANSAYIYRKWKKSSEFKSLTGETDKMTMGRATELTNLFTIDDQIEENTKRGLADTYKTLYDDVSRIVSVIQTRISFLKTEKIQSSINEG